MNRTNYRYSIADKSIFQFQCEADAQDFAALMESAEDNLLTYEVIGSQVHAYRALSRVNGDLGIAVPFSAVR